MKKSLKIPKGQSVSVYRRRTDNTMAKRKKVQKDKQRSTKEEFEDTKGAIRIRISKKNKQHNGQKKRKSIKGQTKISKAHI